MSNAKVVEQGYGGGLNSAGLAVGAYERDLAIHVRLFAHVGSDTQRNEWPETYQHMEIMNTWFVQHGLPEITVVREERFTLEEECLKAGTLPSIVMGLRSCSDKFKIRPQNRWLRAWPRAIAAWKQGEKVLKLVGFDANESHRIKDYDSTLYDVRYPLVEWGWGRDECVSALKRHGLPVPRKSSCFFCPEMQWNEIKELRDVHPELMERALTMERNSRLHSIKGLARSMSWEQALVHIDAGEFDKLPKRMKRIPCACYDGGDDV